MPTYPRNLQVRPELHLKQGIKSSIPEIKQLIGLSIAIYLSEKQSVVDYGVSKGSEIVLSTEQLERLGELFKIEIELSGIKSHQFTQLINSNPLLTAQMEPLQVALQLFLKLSKINFPDGSSSSKERKGGIRYPKRLQFTTNVEIIRICISDLELKPILFKWITNVDSPDDIKLIYDPEVMERLNSLLTIFGEETRFKIRSNNGDEIFFQQEGIYAEIEKGNIVEEKDAIEEVGPFRIFKRFVGAGLHPYLQNINGFSARPHVNWPDLLTYHELVTAYLDVIPKRTTITISPDFLLEENIAEIAQPLPDLPPNRILYGPPGSGKSYKIDETYANGHAQIRVTFHPDSDYNSFVGSYKPVSDTNGDIRYNFVPQAFTNAYLSAWSQPERAVFLIVEEINRGNCAQVFGDLFQCLDRNGNGYSVYPVDADTDLANYLRKAFGESSTAAEQFEQQATNYKNVGSADYHKLILPRNLFIYATMNTSDQSLFPMDSAFKRRWDWEYVPIDYKDANMFTIVFSNELRYSWGEFIRVVNSRIFSLNRSEDKQLGNRFVNPVDKVISLAVFKSKVMFYLWSEIYKNETESSDNLFLSKLDPTKSDTKAFTFSELYETHEHGTGRDLDLLVGFMDTLGVNPLPPTE